MSSQYCTAPCRCVILLCDGYIYLLNSKGESDYSINFLDRCYYQPDCEGYFNDEHFGCCGDDDEPYVSAKDVDSDQCVNW